ncbi:hypothetical protein [Gracilimonas sediminicola]|uniref:hypothetical protein n=1 Tax=Gracilimonas sediminicola TaxID=2952158 RepID=UPI0038D47E21
MADCRLCNEDRKLRKSHIYPEFLYKPLYDEKHKYFSLTTDTDKYIKQPSKGIYEELLCADCEQKLSVYEGYARDVIYEKMKEALKEKGRVLKLTGIDYALYKLFQLSLLWRSSIHSRPELPVLNLGTHQERLRKMILEEDPGEYYQYGVIHISLQMPEELGDDFLFPLEAVEGRFEGHHMYRSIIAGLSWSYIVSNHTYEVGFKEAFLNSKGELLIVRDYGPGNRFLNRLMNDFASHPGMKRFNHHF